MAESPRENLPQIQRLKAAVHYTVGGLCQDVADDQEIQFSKQAIAAISEMTFRQCETFVKDLELFARHAKRSTVGMDDVKLLSRRSQSLHRHICKCSEEIASNNQEKRKKKAVAAGEARKVSEEEPPTSDQKVPAVE